MIIHEISNNERILIKLNAEIGLHEVLYKNVNTDVVERA